MAITAHVTEKTEKQAAFDYNVPVELSGWGVKHKNRQTFYRNIKFASLFCFCKILNADRARGHQDISTAWHSFLNPLFADRHREVGLL